MTEHKFRITLMDDLKEVLSFDCLTSDYQHNAQYIKHEGEVYRRAYWRMDAATYQKCTGIYMVKDLNPIPEEPVL